MRKKTPLYSMSIRFGLFSSHFESKAILTIRVIENMLWKMCDRCFLRTYTPSHLSSPLLFAVEHSSAYKLERCKERESIAERDMDIVSERENSCIAKFLLFGTSRSFINSIFPTSSIKAIRKALFSASHELYALLIHLLLSLASKCMQLSIRQQPMNFSLHI